MGGTVSDVKKYFFSLDSAAIDAVFSAYGREYGALPEDYARQKFPRWKSGSTKMSGRRTAAKPGAAVELWSSLDSPLEEAGFEPSVPPA